MPFHSLNAKVEVVDLGVTNQNGRAPRFYTGSLFICRLCDLVERFVVPKVLIGCLCKLLVLSNRLTHHDLNGHVLWRKNTRYVCVPSVVCMQKTSQKDKEAIISKGFGIHQCLQLVQYVKPCARPLRSVSNSFECVSKNTSSKRLGIEHCRTLLMKPTYWASG